MAEKKALPKGISLRADGRYQARYTFNGKRYTVYGRTAKEVQKKLRDAQYEIDHGIFAKPERITVDDWHKTWLTQFREGKARQTTVNSQEAMYNAHIKNSIGSRLMKDLRVEHLQMILNSMEREGYKSSYIGKTRGMMFLMFEQALQNGIILRNPAAGTVTPKKDDAKEKRVFSPYEQTLFFECLDGCRMKEIFYIGFSTGMRIGEILGLRWRDIDLSKGMLEVTGTLVYVAGSGFSRNPPKTRDGYRTVPLLPEIVKRLKKYKVEQARYRMEYCQVWEPLDGFEDIVFLNSAGRPYTRMAVGK